LDDELAAVSFLAVPEPLLDESDDDDDVLSDEDFSEELDEVVDDFFELLRLSVL
jgi:hypothetical protein